MESFTLTFPSVICLVLTGSLKKLLFGQFGAFDMHCAFLVFSLNSEFVHLSLDLPPLKIPHDTRFTLWSFFCNISRVLFSFYLLLH